jgi:hypothetical protein
MHAVSTVGYGDYSPKEYSSKIFGCFFIPIGVVGAAFCVDSIAVTFKVTNAV